MHKILLGIVAVAVITLAYYPVPARAAECYAEIGLGYVRSNVTYTDDWGNSPPAGFVGADCSWQVKHWAIPNVARIVHISNALEGPPFDREFESNLNYIGFGWRRRIWSN